MSMPFPRASGKAVLSVILGLLCLGPPGLLLGYWGLRDINESDGRIKGRGLAIAGMILGGLGTLLCLAGVPAVWIVGLREKANRASCQNNLRVIGLAVNLYHGDKGPFPPGTIANGALPPGERLSWYVSILPYLDQDPDPAKHRTTSEEALYEHIDRKLAWDAGPNRQLAETPIRWLVCPSQVLPRPGLTSYVGLAGVGRKAARLPVSDPDAGFFGYDRRITRADVTRGLSETMMATETTVDNGPWAEGGPATVRGLGPEQTPFVGPGRQLGGLHPGGLNVLFVDGGISFYSESIDPDVFKAMVKIHGD